MFRNILNSSVFLLIFLFAVSVWADKYTISSFEGDEPGDPDNYIAEEHSGGLKPASPNDITAQSGRFYVRQKFEDPFGEEPPSYQIYRGRSTSAKSELAKISISGVSMSEMIKLKFFISKNPNGDDDLDVVYFDGKDAFVEGDDPVYVYLNGKMTEVTPTSNKEYKISITSQPVGATVTVNDVVKGKAPVTFTVGSGKPIAVVVSMDGYYTAIKPVKPADGKTAQESFSLVTKKPLENPAAAFRTQIGSAKDAAAIKTIKNSIQQKINNYTSETKTAVDAVLTKFPANPPKLSDESPTDFTARQNLWDAERAKEKAVLTEQSNTYLAELKELLGEADAAAGSSEFALRYEYIPSSAISFGNLGIKDFTVSASVKNSRIDFDYKNAQLAYGNVPRNKFVQEQDEVHGVLKIWDKPNENGKYASIYDVEFFHEETPLKMLKKGTFSSPNANATSRSTERDLNNRVAKHSGFTGWSKRDEAAALDVIRAGEIPDASVVAAVPAASSYDEDEEEEFEEEMEEQEERDYAKYGAVGSATDVFGSSDEILFWSGVAFAVAAVTTGVFGVINQMGYSKAQDAIDGTKKKINEAKGKLNAKCGEEAVQDQEKCKGAVEAISKMDSFDGWDDSWNSHTFMGGFEEYENPAALFIDANKGQKLNKATRTSYQNGMIIFFSAAAVSLGLSVTLFAW